MTGDYAPAVQYAEKLAITGNPNAQKLLGSIYANGLGGIQDAAKAQAFYTEAFKTFSSRAEADDVEAQRELAVMYMNGMGTQRSQLQGAFWQNVSRNSSLPSHNQMFQARLNEQEKVRLHEMLTEWFARHPPTTTPEQR